MRLFVWYGLDIGGEYADAWIGVIAKTQERAAELVRNDDRVDQYYGYCENLEPDETLRLHASEKAERVLVFG